MPLYGFLSGGVANAELLSWPSGTPSRKSNGKDDEKRRGELVTPYHEYVDPPACLSLFLELQHV